MTRPDPSDGKTLWRAWAKEVRSALTKVDAQVVTHLRRWPEYRAARHVLGYLAFDAEVDLGELYEDDGKTFYVTRTPDTRTPDTRAAGLTVHRLEGGLELHPYGYLQPEADAEVVEPQTIDLVLVPGLCFDVAGTRLGYGRGYYDRLLPGLRPDAVRVGVNAAALVVARLPREAFDVPMTHLVTETGVVSTRKNANRD